MGLESQPIGTAVPPLRDCSSTPTALQFQPYGTAVPALRDWSLPYKRLPRMAGVRRVAVPIRNKLANFVSE